MTNPQMQSNFNNYLLRIGEQPLPPAEPSPSTALLEVEISELEDKMGLPHELPNDKEADHE